MSTVENQIIRNQKIVVNILSLFPIILVPVIFLFQMTIPDLGTKSASNKIIDENDFTNVLFYALLCFIPIIIIISEKIFVPIAKKVKIENRFASYLTSIAFYESISVYGLLLSLLSMFAITPPYLDWRRYLIFIIISLLLTQYHKRKYLSPWFLKMEDMQLYGEDFRYSENFTSME